MNFDVLPPISPSPSDYGSKKCLKFKYRACCAAVAMMVMVVMVMMVMVMMVVVLWSGQNPTCDDN